MFTGIIGHLGKVREVKRGASPALVIEAAALVEGLKIGDSVAVNGVCLTASRVWEGCFSAAVMPETLRRTNLGELRPGQPVNLEAALRLGEELGGHLVSGHVDAAVRILRERREGNARLLWLELPRELAPLVAPQGSVAVDGISLTVVKADRKSFCLSLIPHTLAHTTLAGKRTGARVNLEVDLLARQVKRILEFER